MLSTLLLHNFGGKLRSARKIPPSGKQALKSVLLPLVICGLVTTCSNNLSQWITSFDNQLATNLLTTSCRKPCERILESTCCRFQQTCWNLRVLNCMARFHSKQINSCDIFPGYELPTLSWYCSC